MNRVFTTLLLFLLFTSIRAQTKRALIVAIGNYVHWPKLSSLNDVDFIKATLTSQGFEKENIKTITEENATHTGITGALNKLLTESRTGDIVVIHFSTHGEQIEDNNGDETDGLDETIVTYNTVAPNISGHFPNFNKDQQEYLRDDEFGAFIEKLRKNLGKKGDVIVFMDLCHSGTITRGSITVRGNKPAGVSLTFNPKKYSDKDTAVFKEKPAIRGDENALATYVVLSAAKAEKDDVEIMNYDNKPAVQMGPLSYAISKVFASIDSGITYRSLFSKIQAILDEKAHGQQGVLEGNGIDRQLFGGRSVSQKPYVEIDRVDGLEIKLKAGLLYGWIAALR